jgi:hypothetical protein
MAEQTIECPKCHKKFPITSALTAQVEERVREEMKKETEQQLKAKDEELEDKLEKAKEKYEEEARQEVDELKGKLKKTKDEYEKKAKKEAESKFKTEMEDLQAQIKEKDGQVDKATKAQLEFLAKEREWKRKIDGQALETAKRVEAERTKVQEEVQKRFQEESRLKDIEKDHQISSLKKTVDDLNRKLEQGSQQSQGEAIEEDIENVLKTTFLIDEIIPIKKGVKGGDIHQKINNDSGKPCGSILWECKRQKDWSDGWISKAKEDRQLVKADIAVVVSEVLPKDSKGFDLLDGVWFTNYQNYISLAKALRSGLIKETIARYQQVGKDQKMEILFKYLTGSEFRNRVEAIMEPFITMKDDLEREKRAVQSSWARREKQLEKVIDNTSGMYGDLQGIMGKSLPEIKTLELPAGE